MNEEKINKIILDIWKKYPKETFTNRSPFLFDNYKTSPKVLFVGINPAYKDSLDGLNIEEFKKHEIKVRGIKKEEAYQYFRPFYDFTSNWEHIDLFFLRETNQNLVKEMLGYKSSRLNDFARSQLDLFIPRLEIIKPAVIVVNNALASNIIKSEFKKYIVNADFNKEGFDRLKLNDFNIPIFFSGMLTGQRALDIESRRRLIWQVKKLIN